MSHIAKTRHYHQVTACALYILMLRAYKDYIENDPENPLESFDIWRSRKAAECPQFHYWSLVMDLELLELMYIRSLREGNFILYIESMKKLAPWFFALDHPNYALWTSVYIQDMEMLTVRHPSVFVEFEHGNFVVYKTAQAFSSIAIDQTHEQHNADVKGHGGATGLFQNSEGLLKWMIGGPEMSRIICEFEHSTDTGNTCTFDDKTHHEQSKGIQVTFAQQVQQLTEKLDEVGSPFLAQTC